MVYPTESKKKLKEDSYSRFAVSVKVDKKGRISIPSCIRKSLGIKPDSLLSFSVSLKDNSFTLKNGCGGVEADRRGRERRADALISVPVLSNTAVCGTAEPGSKQIPFLAEKGLCKPQKNRRPSVDIMKGVCESPGRGPEKNNR